MWVETGGDSYTKELEECLNKRREKDSNSEKEEAKDTKKPAEKATLGTVGGVSIWRRCWILEESHAI